MQALINFKRVLTGGPAPWLHSLILPGRNAGAEPLARTGAANAALQRQTILYQVVKAPLPG